MLHVRFAASFYLLQYSVLQCGHSLPASLAGDICDCDRDEGGTLKSGVVRLWCVSGVSQWLVALKRCLGSEFRIEGQIGPDWARMLERVG